MNSTPTALWSKPVAWFVVFKDIFFGGNPQPLEPLKETSWLDGVRGVAAFLVVMNHYTMEWLSPFAEAPFGSRVTADKNFDSVYYHRKDERLWEVWRLPILRLFMVSGSAMVAIFFVLSGFVLSWGLLDMIRKDQPEKLRESLGSSVIRRWFRLYLPCFLVSIPYMVYRMLRNYPNKLTFWQELWFFISGSEKWANPYNVSHTASFTAVHPYNYVMWTIPFEFAGSIFVYVCMLGLGRIKHFPRRIACMYAISLYSMCSHYWGNWLFGTGLCLADYVREAGGFKNLSQRTTRPGTYLWIVVWVLALLIMSLPARSEWYTSPGWEWFKHIPLPPGYRGYVGATRVFYGVGASLFIFSSCHLAFVRRIFESRVCQYLGKISFMLYLIHILVNMAVSLPLRMWFYSMFTHKEHSDVFNGEMWITTPFLNFAVYCATLIVSVTLAMSASHVLEICVDRPCTKFGRLLDGKVVHGLFTESLVKPHVVSEANNGTMFVTPIELNEVEMTEAEIETLPLTAQVRGSMERDGEV